jgi:ABC-type glycerol-3-phosphate transport system substrate-binding protein
MAPSRLRSGAAGLAALTLAASAAIAAPVAAQDPVTIQFWQPDTREDWIAARDQVIADFEAANPDINVEVTPIDWGQLLPKLQSAVA